MRPAKQWLTGLLRSLPGGQRVVDILRVQRWRLHGRRHVFTLHYENNWWGDEESRSGAGATFRYTENIRREIPRLLAQLGVRRLLDAPCGDFNWFRRIELPSGIQYTGGDIVKPLIQTNSTRYGNDLFRFLELDITHDVLPAADLWLCRAALFHFSDRDIWATLRNFLRSDIPYLLTSTLPGTALNHDIVTGHYRPLNLEAPPFSFSPPQHLIDDWIPGFDVMSLALWSKDAVSRCLASNADFQRFHARTSR